MQVLESNNNVLIVGASQGIGLGFVRALLQNEAIAKIHATYRHEASATELIALGQKHPQRLLLLQVNVTDESQIATAIRQISTTANQLHLVIYCVGVLHEGKLTPEKSLRQIDSKNLLYYFQVNSIGAVLLAKHLMPLLRHGDRSVFASISAKVGSIGDNRLGGWYGYRASKASLNMLLRTTAIEYSRRCPNTIVVALHPGTTDTRLSRPFQKNLPPEKLFSVDYTVNLLLAVLKDLNIKDSGKFFSWDGTLLPW
ncbi:SDR family NAD(P)-dependent oxidoreductase [Myxosarcina sp. GI1(2024)]